MRELHTDILIVGGGLGGVAGALAALRLGRKVILTEETDWIGGQLTAQAVPPDESPWIESTGCTRSYRRLREAIRDYYRRNYPLLPGTARRRAAQPRPGTGQPAVSRAAGCPGCARGNAGAVSLGPAARGAAAPPPDRGRARRRPGSRGNAGRGRKRRRACRAGGVYPRRDRAWRTAAAGRGGACDRRRKPGRDGRAARARRRCPAARPAGGFVVFCDGLPAGRGPYHR